MKNIVPGMNAPVPRPFAYSRFVLSRDVVSTTNKGMRQYNGVWQLSKPYREYKLHIFLIPGRYVTKLPAELEAAGFRITAQQQQPDSHVADLFKGRYLEDRVSVFLSKTNGSDVEWIQVVGEKLLKGGQDFLFKLYQPKWKPKNHSLIAEYEKLMKEYAASPYASFLDHHSKVCKGSERAERYSDLLDAERQKAEQEKLKLLEALYSRIGFKVRKIADVEFDPPMHPDIKEFFFNDEVDEAIRTWHQIIDLVEVAG